MKRILIPLAAFMLGGAFIASFYLGILSLAQGWDYGASQFMRDRGTSYRSSSGLVCKPRSDSILRFRLFVPTKSMPGTGTMMGASGGTSITAMVACCIHHVTDVLPILGLSVAASFLARHQRPFMLVGIAMNLIGIGVMFFVLNRERRKFHLMLVETK